MKPRQTKRCAVCGGEIQARYSLCSKCGDEWVCSHEHKRSSQGLPARATALAAWVRRINAERASK